MMGSRLSFDKFAECGVVPLHNLIEAIHAGSLPLLALHTPIGPVTTAVSDGTCGNLSQIASQSAG